MFIQNVETNYTRVRWDNSEGRNLTQGIKYAHIYVHINSADVIKLWKEIHFYRTIQKRFRNIFRKKNYNRRAEKVVRNRI
jgi:hypothetical protein